MWKRLVFFFVLPFLSKPHMSFPSSMVAVTFLRGGLRCGRATTAFLGVLRAGSRVHGAVPKRTKGALVGVHEDYIRSRMGGARKDKGCVGWRLCMSEEFMRSQLCSRILRGR